MFHKNTQTFLAAKLVRMIEAGEKIFFTSSCFLSLPPWQIWSMLSKLFLEYSSANWLNCFSERISIEKIEFPNFPQRYSQHLRRITTYILRITAYLANIFFAKTSQNSVLSIFDFRIPLFQMLSASFSHKNLLIWHSSTSYRFKQNT